ncbi:MAG: TRAP transporter permease [Negativicutes bacterium]
MFNDADLFFGALLTIILLAATWIVYGVPITTLMAVALLYLFFGQHLPGDLGHPGVHVERAISNLSLFTEGIFGSALAASATVISAFIIFAAFVQVSGGGELFMDLSIAAFGRFKGGAAKVAVFGSTLFGMISGSAAANCAGVGMITIPLMKRSGFPPIVAGAIEACASSGGQIMPPIMGAAAFIIAEILGVSYSEVIIAAIIPALIYYGALFVAVDLYARKHDIQDAPVEREVKLKEVLAKKGHTLLPLVVLILLIADQRTPQMAALGATITVVLVSFLRKETRFTLKMLGDGLYQGAVGILEIAVICASAGIVLAVFTATGIGLQLSAAIIDLAGGSLFMLLFLSMIASLILGMGVPTVAAYLILAVLVVPALIEFGVVPMAAHLFIFYFGIISAITPPVAIAAYVAGGIAGADPVKVGFAACGFALPVFLVPYVFVYQPALIFMGPLLVQIQVIATTIIGSAYCAVGVIGYLFTKMYAYERFLALTASILLVIPEGYTDIAGIVLAAIVSAKLYYRAQKEKKPKVLE